MGAKTQKAVFSQVLLTADMSEIETAVSWHKWRKRDAAYLLSRNMALNILWNSVN